MEEVAIRKPRAIDHSSDLSSDFFFSLVPSQLLLRIVGSSEKKKMAGYINIVTIGNCIYSNIKDLGYNFKL